MEEPGPNGDILILDNELILDWENGGEGATVTEPGVLLLSNEIPPEPVVKTIDVGQRISIRDLPEFNIGAGRAFGSGIVLGRKDHQPPRRVHRPARDDMPSPVAVVVPVARDVDAAARSAFQDAGLRDLVELLSEARQFAINYGTMKARTHTALYVALGRTYDLAVHAEGQAEDYARLIEKAGLPVQERAPYSPIVKLVFGADYDKTRVAEFAAAITYGRRKKLSAGEFFRFLNECEGGLKAVVRLERLIRKGDGGVGDGRARIAARPAIASKLRKISPKAWVDVSMQGDEFALLVVRRLPDCSIAIVGEVPRDIALLEKAARKLLADLTHEGD